MATQWIPALDVGIQKKSQWEKACRFSFPRFEDVELMDAIGSRLLEAVRCGFLTWGQLGMLWGCSWRFLFESQDVESFSVTDGCFCVENRWVTIVVTIVTAIFQESWKKKVIKLPKLETKQQFWGVTSYILAHLSSPTCFATQKFASQTRCFTCFVKQLPQTELFQSYLWTLYLPSDQGFQHLKLVGQDLVWVPQIDVSTQLVEAPFFDWAPRLIVPGALQRPKGGEMGGGREFLRDL